MAGEGVFHQGMAKGQQPFSRHCIGKRPLAPLLPPIGGGVDRDDDVARFHAAAAIRTFHCVISLPFKLSKNLLSSCASALFLDSFLHLPARAALPVPALFVKQPPALGGLDEQTLELCLVAANQRPLQPLEAGGKLVDFRDEVVPVRETNRPCTRPDGCCRWRSSG